MEPFFRILKYILNYKTLVIIALLCSVVYAVMYGFSVYLIGPFLEKLFSSDVYVEEIIEQKSETGKLRQIKIFLRGKVDNMLGSGTPRQVLARLSFLIIAGILLKNIFSYLQGYIMAYVEQGVIKNLREDLYAAYHRLPLRYFQKKKTGELISRVINDCNTINANLNSSLINLMKEPITVAVFLFLTDM